MEHEQEAVTAGSSHRGNAVVTRALYPLAPLHTVCESEPYARMPPWMEADPADTDAPISVWWDYPPS
jgi:hypothetical protein